MTLRWRRSRRSAAHVLAKPYRSGSLGVDFAAFAGPLCGVRWQLAGRNGEPARQFFEREFSPAGSWRRPAAAASSPASTSRGRSFAGAHRAVILCRCCRARPTSSTSTTSTGRQGWTHIFAFAAADRGRHRRVFRPRRDRAGRACRARAGARLARPTRSMPSSSMSRARRGCSMTDGATAPRHLCGQDRPSLHRARQVLAELGEIPREDVTMQSIRALARATTRRASTRSSGRTAPTSSSAKRRSTIPRSVRLPRRRCR